ncbi:alpha-hydroxy-acid oxidizing protein [Kribbella sandramycini]|uniref:4-hydroxymandelate oxidase n=1 Tax=Kribbella sandramycini TaxID=60450 RepID=A0A7Y4L0X2_9ACTN|nr:alpha-hydroxy acid oxidase [Kribbella sandramycini]MBB6564589.1 4-hydroxymandelate oxidase [Kribbella sandramycini]NOL42293.1 alpha-hydroxy-acid oxidizing protein [Kribbella sandramycini]
MPETLAGYEPAAAAVLPAAVRDFVAGGSGAELTLHRNRAALDAITVTPRILGAVDQPKTTTKLLRTPCALPLAVAPMAYQKLLHPEGELLLAAAAAAAGVPYVISTLSSTPLEKIAAAAPSWFQLYWLRDRNLVGALIDRATEAGCHALMVTVDVPIMGQRLRDVRNGFALPPEVIAANLVDKYTEAHKTPGTGSAIAAHTALAFDPAFSWRDLEWIRRRTDLPLVLKGILDPRDALTALDAGADGLVVSNHGGRQFDGAPAAIDALSSVIDAVGNEMTVLLDSGIRSGADIVKALARGAHGVLVGRPLLWALALGVPADALTTLGRELRDAMLLAGCADLTAVADLITGRD